jgi:predicted transcriptional regulator
MRRLGSLESELMQCLWSADQPVSVREVLACLGRDDLAYTTVMSTLSNLYGKGLLDRHIDGRAYRYTPRESRESYSASLMSDALSASHDPEATLLRLVDHLTPEQAQALRTVLAEHPAEPGLRDGPDGGARDQ